MFEDDKNTRMPGCLIGTCIGAWTAASIVRNFKRTAASTSRQGDVWSSAAPTLRHSSSTIPTTDCSIPRLATAAEVPASGVVVAAES